MTPKQIEEEIRKELRLNRRLTELLTQHAKVYSDELYRSTANVIDHAGLLRLTGAAAGVEEFVGRLTAFEKDRFNVSRSVQTDLE